MPVGSDDGRVERIKRALLAWTFALILLVALVSLLAATSESLRRHDRSFPYPESLEPSLAPQNVEAPDAYHHPGVAGWPTP